MAKVTFSGVIIFILLMTIALFGLNAIVGKDFRYMSETSHSTSDRREQLGESLNAHMIVVETKRFFFENVFRVGQEENYRKISSFQLTDVLIEDGKHQLKSSSKVKIETDRLATKSCSIPNPAQRFDCHPEVNGTREICEMRGCCWQETKLRVKPLIAINYTDTQTPVDIPFCFYPLDFPGYTVAAVKETDLGVSLDLHTDHQFYYPRTVMNLRVDVMLETDARLHVKIYDADNSRYEVPLPVPKVSKAAASTRYMVTTSGKDEPFTITVDRIGGGKSVFDMRKAAPLVFTDQFLQLSSVLPSSYMMGLGEHRMDLMQNLNWTRHTMWNIDQYPREDVDMYGSHPFYLVMEEGGRASGFFLLNSNAMDVVLQPYPAVTWKTIGGILDFYVFIGDNPADVISEYTKVIGRTFMPPYWGLGFHVCRFGYKNVSDTLRVTNRIRQLGIPQDVQWNDIDYAIGRRDFTTDKKIFGDQPAMVEELHSRGMRYIIITDPGIDPSQPPGTYPPFDVGKEMDIFMRNHTGQLFVGKVWTDETVWVDYSHPRADKYWTQMVTDFHKKVPIDGLWIDMNEVSNFVDGSRLNSPGCPNTTYDHPPFVPAVRGGYLYKKTSCPSCRQYISRNYDVHNLYGLMETNLTNRALRAARSGKRAFVISRSTFAGQGHFGGHWTGDNIGTFHDMYRSISVILRMGMFGIPMVGADICGFQGNATYEMCLRFYQLGAFYPFSRTHNDFKSNDQDPGAFDRHFADIVREAYLIRYSMLPLLYTLFYNSHITGAPVARAMFYEFPHDAGCYRIDTQMMWGSQLLIVPVLQEKARKVVAYLPAGSLWYDFYNGARYPGTGSYITMDAPLSKINLLLQGGSIIARQDPALTTTESRLNDFSLWVCIGGNGTAKGSLYWDQGDSYDFESGIYNYIEFQQKQNSLESQVLKSKYNVKMMLTQVQWYGFPAPPTQMTLNGVTQQPQYDPKDQILYVTLNPPIDLKTPFSLTWQ